MSGIRDGSPLEFVPERQPDGMCSGATCIRMLAGALLGAHRRGHQGMAGISSLYVRELMGHQDAGRGMCEGLSAFGMDWQRHAGEDLVTSMDNLVRHLDTGGAAILRGMRRGRDHWVLATRSYLDGIGVIDPETGAASSADEDDVEAFMAGGKGEFWSVPENSSCRDLRIGLLNRDERWTQAIALVSKAVAARFLDEREAAAWVGTQGDPGSSIGIHDDGHLLAAIVMREVDPVTACRMDDLRVPSSLKALEARIGEERSAWVVGMASAPGHDYNPLLKAMPGEIGCRWCFSFGKGGENSANWQSTVYVIPIGGMGIFAGMVGTVRPQSDLRPASPHPLPSPPGSR